MSSLTYFGAIKRVNTSTNKDGEVVLHLVGEIKLTTDAQLNSVSQLARLQREPVEMIVKARQTSLFDDETGR